MGFEARYTIEWGDCDDAGIVFYPNFFYWMDCTYQRWLRHVGLGQRQLNERFGALTPLVNVGADFRAPASYDDALLVRATIPEWSERAFLLRYIFIVGDRTIADGHERRAWAVRENGRLRGAPVDARFRALMSSDADRA